MLRELPKPLVAVPAITAAQMQLVNRLLADEYLVDPLSAIDMGGRHLAHLARLQFLKGRADGKSIVALVGNAYKGAVVLAAARRLHQWGANMRLVLSHPIEDYEGLVNPYLQRAQRQGVIIVEQPTQGGNLILDGLMGLNWQGDPAGRIAELIDWANRQLTPVLAIELCGRGRGHGAGAPPMHARERDARARPAQNGHPQGCGEAHGGRDFFGGCGRAARAL